MHFAVLDPQKVLMRGLHDTVMSKSKGYAAVKKKVFEEECTAQHSAALVSPTRLLPVNNTTKAETWRWYEKDCCNQNKGWFQNKNISVQACEYKM